MDLAEQEHKRMQTIESIAMPRKRRVFEDDLLVDDTSEVRKRFQQMEVV
jgi:hypothetical protein